MTNLSFPAVVENTASVLIDFFVVPVPVLFAAVASEDEDCIGHRGRGYATLSTAAELVVYVLATTVPLTDNEFRYWLR